MKLSLSSSSKIESNCVCTHDKVLTATAETDFMLTTHNKQANIKAAHSDGDETKKKISFPPLGMSENLHSERSFAKAQLSVI